MPDAPESGFDLLRKFRKPVYLSHYGYRWLDAVWAEFWWRVEHSWLNGPLRGYQRRKAAERRGIRRAGEWKRIDAALRRSGKRPSIEFGASPRPTRKWADGLLWCADCGRAVDRGWPHDTGCVQFAPEESQ